MINTKNWREEFWEIIYVSPVGKNGSRLYVTDVLRLVQNINIKQKVFASFVPKQWCFFVVVNLSIHMINDFFNRIHIKKNKNA